MKYQLGAAVAALVLGLVPGTVIAGQASSWIVATNYASITSTVSGVDKSWNQQSLRHSAATVHNFVANPNAFPPDPCRVIASAWNVAVFQNRPKSAFDSLLKLSAQNQCAFSVVRSDSPNADGSFDLVSIAPSP